MSRTKPCRRLVAATILLSLSATVSAQTAKKWDLFLLFGQSNMAGPPAGEAQDKVTNPRIKVLAYDNCSALGRTFNQWYPASPPLHECFNGVGPADYFSKTLIDTSDKLGLGIDTIGLIPCAISGVSIDIFRIGKNTTSTYTIPPSPNTGTNAYSWMVSRIKEAQKKGVVRGILFHQGESNNGDPNWPANVKEVVDALKKDLSLGDIPFIAGELRYQLGRSTNESCCTGHNTQVAKLPGLIKNSSVVSAKGLTGLQDPYHFDLASMRTFGHRYCAAMVPYLKNSTSIFSRNLVNGTSSADYAVFDVKGARVAGFHAMNEAALGEAWTGAQKNLPGGIYWVRNTSTGAAQRVLAGR